MPAALKNAKVQAEASDPESVEFAYAVEQFIQADTPITRVVAMAASAGIAYATFSAAAREYPDKRVILRRGRDVLFRLPSGPKKRRHKRN